jgi:hypothetical protein
LARLYDYDKFRQLAQIDVDDASATVTLRAPRSEFARLAEKIIADMHDNKINTRVLNKTSLQSYKDYMDDLRNLLNEAVEDVDDENDEPDPPAPASRSGGDGDGSSRHGGGGQPPGGSGTTSTSGDPKSSPDEKPKPVAPEKPKKKQRNFLNTEQLQVPDTFPESIRAILAELSTLNIQRFPNAALDILRTFLEKTIKAYAEVKGEEIKKSSNEKGFVFLSNCLVWLEQHVKDLGLTAYVQVIVKIRSGKISGYVSSMDHLNAINHNHQIVATPEDVRDCWTVMESLLKVMLKP